MDHTLLKIKEIRVRLERIDRLCQRVHKKRTYGKNPIIISIQQYVKQITDIITEDCPNFDKKTKICNIFKESCEIILKKECSFSKENIKEVN